MTKLVNRAKMTTATTGTGTITLGSAEAGYQSFTYAGVVDGDVVRYVIEDDTDWEIGTGTFTATGATLTRTVSESSNADAALNLTGDAVVYVSATAEDIPSLELYAENPSSPTAPSATGTNAVAIGHGAIASGNYANALGDGTASGNYSTAIGYVSTSSGASSLALGAGANAGANSSTAIGRNSGGGGSRTAAGAGATALSGSYASGTDSFAAAIASNTPSYGANGTNSVAIGYYAKASGSYSTAIGFVSVAAGSYSVAIGPSAGTTSLFAAAIGYGASAQGTYASAIGYQSTATRTHSVAIGTRSLTRVDGQISFGNDRIGTSGDNQACLYILKSDTTDATPEALTTNNSTAGSTNQIILPNNSAYAFHGTIVARQQATQGTACAAFKIEGLIRREGNAASTVLVNSATTVLDNTPGWGMTLSADTTNGGLAITVTGATATNIRFVATISTSEVTF